MTTGATGQLGLALPVQGELSGTWGDTVNNGITQYTNIAIAGTLTLTGDGAVTLANTTGDASASNITSTLAGAGTVTAQFAIVRVTGTLTVAKVVTGPSYSKTYTVVNAATGGIVTFKAAGQTGVSVAVGESASVYFNGTDYVKVAGTAAVTSFSAGTTGFTPNTATTGAITLAGTLATTNGGTGLTSFTSGGVVYASSTSALATGSVLTWDGSNFSLKTRSSALFYNANNDNYGKIQGAAGSASELIFSTNSEGMRLTDTGLGIGTSSPSAKLQIGDATVATSNRIVFGKAIASSESFLPAIGQQSSSGAGNDLALAATSTSGVVRFYTGASTNSGEIGTGSNTEKMRLDSAGNLGLGVTPNTWTLGKSISVGDVGSAVFGFGGYNSLTSGAYFNSGWKYSSSSTSQKPALFVGSDGGFSWSTAASGTAGDPISFTQAMTLDASGNLGLGTTSPSGVSTFPTMDIRGSGGGALRVGTTSGASAYLYCDTNVVLGTASATATLTFQTNTTERARIDSSGNLLVGTTDSNPNSGDGVKMNAGTGARTSIVGAADTNANFAITVYSRSPSAYRFQVGYGGTIYATSTSITAISDQTLKTNVRNLETGLTEVMALQPRRFDWINGDASNVAGFIAQEVQQVLPDLVEDYQYSDEETKLGLKMGDILPTLVKAIQEQQAIIESLKARLDAANL